ncbi:MAG TPA: hypothetical protein VIX14_13530 [Terriglobales bacterium]
MKQPYPNPQHLQFNLPLAETSPAEIPADQTEQLVLALAELLLGAANESLSPAATGGQDESKADR